MKSGTVKWFDAAKGFGFIIPSDGGADIYINLKVLQKAGLGTLEPGAAVNFRSQTVEVRSLSKKSQLLRHRYH